MSVRVVERVVFLIALIALIVVALDVLFWRA